MNSLDEFLFRADADLAQHGARHLAEEVFHQIQPGTVFGNEDELKSLGPSRQIALRLAGDVRRMVVQNKPQGLRGGIAGVKFSQELNEVAALVRGVDDLGHPSAMQIEAREQGHGSEALIFVVPDMAGMESGNRRPVRSRHGQRLNAGLLVIRHRHRPGFANSARHQSLIEDLHFLVHVQHRRHFLIKLRVPSLHIVPDLMRLEFALRQNLVQFRPAQARQFSVTSRPCLAVDVLGQQLIGPQFLGIPQIFWLLARQILYPCNGFVGNLARLARPWQLSQRRLQSKAKVFSNAKDHGISIHLTGRSICLIHHAIGRIQQNSRTHRPPLLFRPRSTDRFEAGTILGTQYETRTLPAIGHAPLKHSRYKMSMYLENANLVLRDSSSSFIPRGYSDGLPTPRPSLLRNGAFGSWLYLHMQVSLQSKAGEDA